MSRILENRTVCATIFLLFTLAVLVNTLMGGSAPVFGATPLAYAEQANNSADGPVFPPDLFERDKRMDGPVFPPDPFERDKRTDGPVFPPDPFERDKRS